MVGRRLLRHGVCSLRIDGDRSVTATFDRSVQLTITIDGRGTLETQPTGTSCGQGCREFAAGTTVKLTAEPISGSYFSRWNGLPDCTRTQVAKQSGGATTIEVTPVPGRVYDNPCTVTLRENVSAAAIFDAAVG